MNDKAYLRSALESHEKGDESRADVLLLEGLNHYSRLISDAYNGCNKSDLLLLACALRIHAKNNFELLPTTGQDVVVMLEKRISAVVIHN